MPRPSDHSEVVKALNSCKPNQFVVRLENVTTGTSLELSYDSETDFRNSIQGVANVIARYGWQRTCAVAQAHIVKGPHE